ncbi:hypothetical protein M426DRAFT_23743 [Hypoxylon sp. CI-4A]|nr:hypothetical protein M426DRAFT_23743 [Hypoxylon sp. CI-4A]
MKSTAHGELRISGSARRFQARYPRTIGFQLPLVSRSYSATAALRFPRQISRESTIHSTKTNQASEVEGQQSSENGTVETSSDTAVNAPAGDLDQAKREGIILDFSSESIDSLVANLERPSTKNLTPRNVYVDSTVQLESESGSAPPPARSSRLKRLKIIKEDKKEGTGTQETLKRKEHWQIQKEALQQKFPEGWSPRKRLSPDALDGIRALHAQFPEDYTTEVLAEKFLVSPEAIRRILRSKWTPNSEQEESRQERWFNRGKNIWTQMAALGKKPPRRWRREGIVRDHIWNRPKGPRTQPPRYPRRYE